MRKFVCLFVCLFVFGTANAAVVMYDFDVSHNSVTTALDVGSDNPIGTNLAVGDSFNYNVEADVNDFWQVDVGGSFFPFLAFGTSDSADRVADITLSLLLDGVQQFTIATNGLQHAFVHIGTNAITLATGLQFDEMILDYELTASTNVNNRITSYFYANRSPEAFGGISYTDNSASSVPEPASLALFGLGLAGLGFSRKKKAA